MNDSISTTCTIRMGWLVSTVLAVASLFPVSGVAAEWDVAIEGGYAPARELLSAQHARLEVNAAGVFVSGLFDEYTRMPAVVRYAPNTTVPAWTSMLGHTSGSAATSQQRVIPATDGSSLVIGPQLTRLDANGVLQWAAYPGNSEKAVAAATLPDGDALVIVDQPFSWRRHGAATGRLIHSSSKPGCHTASLIAVDASTAYIARTCTNPQLTETVYEVVQIDPATGQVRWTYLAGSSPTITADESAVYVFDRNLSIIKLAAADGTFIWNFFRSSGLRSLGSVDNGDLISSYDVGTVSNPIKRIERIDRITGLSLWARDIPGTFNARANRDAVVMTGNTSVGGLIVPYVEVLDAASGAIAWRTDIAVPTGTQVRVSDAVANGSHVVALGKQCPAPAGDVRCELTIWHLDRLSGAIAATQPMMVQSAVISDTKTAADGKVWTAAIDWVATGQRLRLFAHNADNGAVLVETELATPMSTPSATLPAESVSLAIGTTGNIAVMLKRRGGYVSAHDAVVLSFDSAGAFRWRKSLLAGLPDQTGVTAELASVDSAGNVLLGKQEFFGQPQPWTGYTVNKRWMARLATANGAVEWQREFQPTPSGNLFFPNAPQGIPVNDDLAIREPPVDETWAGAARMTGANGDVAWVNSEALPWPLLYVPGPTSLLAVGTQPATRIRFDPVSGATKWVAQYAYPGDQFFFQWKVLESAMDNRYLLSTTRRTGGLGIAEKNGALMLSVDTQTGALVWANRFEPKSSNRFERMDAIGVVDNRIYATGPSQSLANYAVGLMALDAATGTEGEVRALQASSWRIVDDVGRGVGDAMKLVDGDALLRWPLRPQVGKAPYPTLARRDLGTQAASGDISVTLDWSRTAVAGMPGADFTFTATNAGPDDAEGVRSIIDVPSDSPLLDVTCAINAVPCEVVIGAAWIRGVHSIPAGAQLMISARFAETSTFGTRSVFSASAVGPFRLVEPTLNDNFAESELGTADLIMRTGFD